MIVVVWKPNHVRFEFSFELVSISHNAFQQRRIARLTRCLRALASLQQTHRLDEVCFVPESTRHAFGIVDPKYTVRGVHLIPCFAGGRTEARLGPSNYRDPEGDWESFYVNR